MGEIGRRLLTLEKISPVVIPKNKNSILLSEDYYDFAVDQLKACQVTLFGVQDKVQNNIFPKYFKKYLFSNELSKLNNQVVNQKQVLIKKQM